MTGKKFILGGEKLFSTRLFLKQLAYTEDLEDKEKTRPLTSYLTRRLTPKRWKRF